MYVTQVSVLRSLWLRVWSVATKILRRMQLFGVDIGFKISYYLRRETWVLYIY